MSLDLPGDLILIVLYACSFVALLSAVRHHARTGRWFD